MSFFFRALAILGCLLLLGGLSPAVAADRDGAPAQRAVPVERTMSVLCTGYAGCRDAGMPNAGYQAHNDRMYWRMYAGHNCTNYVAYRMVKSGMSNERPWSGSGNATNWGRAMASLTDDTPVVGAVAWWAANVPPAGSAGHVAYVEQVLSPDEIIVSQDSWGGDFSWARITREGGRWPSGFIHFNDVTLENTEKPLLTGTPKVGAVLSAAPGAWKPASTETRYTYEWRAGQDPITRTSGATLKLRRSEQGRRISVRVTASRVGFPTATARSDKTPVVEPGVITNTVAPRVSGSPTVDSLLTATAGSWSPEPASVAYQWYADGVLLEGVTGSTYAPGAAQVDRAISVTATASRPGYEDVSASSTATGPVQRASFVARTPPSVDGVARYGQSLVVDRGRITPEAAEVQVVWLRGGVPIDGATAAEYRPTSEDLGYRLASRVTWLRPGYHDLVVTTAPSGRIKTDPLLSLRSSRPGAGRLAVHVSVAAPGLDAVPGTVLVTSRGRVLARLALGPDGRVARVLKGLPAGERTFKVRYLGTDRVTSTMLAKTVTIK